MKRIGYLGPRGTFSEEAARAYTASGSSASGETRLCPYRSIPEILSAVDTGDADLGIVPIENSIQGPETLTVDVLVHDVELSIRGEIVIAVTHNLLARPGARLEDIREVYSHPQALAQCRLSLNRRLPWAVTKTASSTAEAAKIAADSLQDQGVGALGTELAARIYGLSVLAPRLEDVEGNATRFVVIGRDDALPTGKDKTSIVFSTLTDRPGVLHEILGEFASRHINLTKIESRPARRTLGEYIFLIDLEGHRTDPSIGEALDRVKAASGYFRVLGSYPRGQRT
ncbi:MAG: prephenate dehydratase [Firmicutes bacterium]|nr:prephenate dehydratase [Bacillota bacterium]